MGQTASHEKSYPTVFTSLLVLFFFVFSNDFFFVPMGAKCSSFHAPSHGHRTGAALRSHLQRSKFSFFNSISHPQGLAIGREQKSITLYTPNWDAFIMALNINFMLMYFDNVDVTFEHPSFSTDSLLILQPLKTRSFGQVYDGSCTSTEQSTTP